MLKCVWCSRPVWVWQSSRPLGGGLLLDDYGQREHTLCQQKRFALNRESDKQIAKTLRMIRSRRT